jgi:predicted nucleic acid-binding protein
MATSKIYIDSCCLIESFKGDLGTADPARLADLDMLKRLLRAARDEKITAYTSMLTVAEVIKAGESPADDDLKRKIERLILSGRDGLTTVALTPDITKKARDLAWDDGLISIKGADRIHLASAIDAEAKEFLSWDNRLGKRMAKIDLKGMKLIAPSSSIFLPVEYRTDDLFKKG